MCSEAWANTKASIIHNFFQHLAIRTPPSYARIICEVMIEEPALIQELNQQIRQFAFSNPMEINFLLSQPAENGTSILLTDEEIVQQSNR
ncbi:hypothetical protein GcM3_038017 [Golovinomyces cichoracearum]|uniref:Uncharacterized protein n=1 Tax=Golovinomyces cichoracearum TaxID=62708 RepID=A0A420J2Z9_9PEZI|nr:hypothetical protein GcM3_038017 [Golovinomyces cichoracearum]